MDGVPRDHRHHHVELELTGFRRHRDRRVAPYHLEADLVHHLRHRRVHLARHDRRAGLDGRQRDLRQTGARSHAEQAQIARHLSELHGQTSHRARVREHVAHALRHAKQIDRGFERQPRVAREVVDDETPVVVAGVEAGADGRGADVQFVQLLGRDRHIVRARADACGVAAELLSERDRHRVLQVRASRFQHVGEFVGLAREALDERTGRSDERRRAEQQREPRRRRKDVVGRLSHVDVVVRVHARVGAARFAEDLGRAVGEHLVRVHVVRRTGAGLVDVDDELIAERAADDLVGGLDDRTRDIAFQTPERRIGFGRRLLDENRRDDQVGRRAQTADRKILDGAGGLHAVVRIGGNLHFAEGIALDAIGHGSGLLWPQLCCPHSSTVCSTSS